jgi:hypothetical protein
MGALVDFIQRVSFTSGLIRFARFEENSDHMWAIAAARRRRADDSGQMTGKVSV